MTKIKISYTDDNEIAAVMTLLKPILGDCRIQRSNRKDPYKCVFITPKKTRNRRK